MDSALAADETAVEILETLALLERAAGVRAHYRILEPPPLATTDLTALQLAARLIGDGIGLRNALFHVSLGDGDAAPAFVRRDQEQEEISLELPRQVADSVTTALGALARQMARAYLMKTSIRYGSAQPDEERGPLADITAVFLGLGKLMLNGAVRPNAAPASTDQARQSLPITRPPRLPVPSLPPKYLAFCYRTVCAMRGLDWTQFPDGLSDRALAELKQWDAYRDSVFSLSLRNVLTPSATYQPLLDAVEDNQRTLARLEQMITAFQDSFVNPLRRETESYHAKCKSSLERAAGGEQDTYDPCMVYLNQVRNRLDLQHYTDFLAAQKEAVLRRTEGLTAALEDLNARQLLTDPPPLKGELRSQHRRVVCPLDHTPIEVPGTDAADSADEFKEIKVQCPVCGYSFISAPPLSPLPGVSSAGTVTAGSASEESASTTEQTKKQSIHKSTKSASSNEGKPVSAPSQWPAPLLAFGFALLALSWAPLIFYVLWSRATGLEMPLTDTFGLGGIAGASFGVLLIIISLAGLLRNLSRRQQPGARDTHV